MWLDLICVCLFSWLDDGHGGVWWGGRAGYSSYWSCVALCGQEKEQEKTQLWSQETQKYGENFVF